jgi:predicted phage tail protein
MGTEHLRDVRLYGALGKKYGRVHRLAVRSCREAAQALARLLPGFAQDVIGHEAGFHVFAGTKDAEGNIGPDALDAPIGQGESVFLVPVIAGRKQRGLLQTVIGVILIVVGYYTGGSTVGPGMAMLGAGLALGGIIQMVAAKSLASSDEDARSESYRFSGPANITRQGVPVPVVYGEVIAGSVVASQGLKSVEKALA